MQTNLDFFMIAGEYIDSYRMKKYITIFGSKCVPSKDLGNEINEIIQYNLHWKEKVFDLLLLSMHRH